MFVNFPCFPPSSIPSSVSAVWPLFSPCLSPLGGERVLTSPHCGRKQLVMHCSGTLSLLLFLSPTFTFSPPVFLGTQVFQKFHETSTQAVQVCVPSSCQKALSRWVFPKSPSTFANETAEQELIYHSVITLLRHERVISRMNYRSSLRPMQPVHQGKQMLRCVNCQPPKQLTFVILINSLLCWNKLLWEAMTLY